MSEPSLNLITALPMNSVFTATGEITYMQYKLYAMNEAFNDWAAWATDSTNAVTDNKKTNATFYSSYVLKMRCNILAFNSAANKQATNAGENSGCCFKNDTWGAVCVMGAATGATYKTYVMKAAQYTTFSTSETLAADTLAIDNSQNDPYFELFACPGSVDYDLVCYKF